MAGSVPLHPPSGLNDVVPFVSGAKPVRIREEFRVMKAYLERMKHSRKPRPGSLLQSAGAMLLLVLAWAAPAKARSLVVDLRSSAEGPLYLVSFLTVAKGADGRLPAALVVWGSPDASGREVLEVVGLFDAHLLGSEPQPVEGIPNTTMYFAGLPQSAFGAFRFDLLASPQTSANRNSDYLTLLLDRADFEDAHAIFGGPRRGTFFEDRAIASADLDDYGHGIGLSIAYMSSIASRLGEAVPDTLNVANLAQVYPEDFDDGFTPRGYLRRMIATAMKVDSVETPYGLWTGETFGNRPNGRGHLDYVSGAEYDGEVHGGALRGRGVLQAVSGLRVDGLFDNNEPVEGTVNYPDGEVFTGPMEQDRARVFGYLVDFSR